MDNLSYGLRRLDGWPQCPHGDKRSNGAAFGADDGSAIKAPFTE